MYINDFNWILFDFIIMGILIFSCLSFTGFIRINLVELKKF